MWNRISGNYWLVNNWLRCFSTYSFRLGDNPPGIAELESRAEVLSRLLSAKSKFEIDRSLLTGRNSCDGGPLMKTGKSSSSGASRIDY